MRFAKLLLAVCGALLVGAALSITWREPAARAAGGVESVAVVKVTRAGVAQEASFTAELRPYQEVALYSKVAGYLRQIRVDAGDRVKAGQLIAAIDVPELNDQMEHVLANDRKNRSEIDRAQAAFEEADIAHKRLAATQQAQPGAVAPQDVDAARARARAAEAALAGARMQGEVYQTDVKRLRTLLGYAQLTAPFAGVVTKRFADPGALIQAGTSSGATPLVRLSQDSKLRVVFPVSLSFAHRIKVGAPVEIQVTAMEGKPFSAKVERLSRKVDTATRTMDAEAELANPSYTLIPGMYATVRVKLDGRDNALLAPIEAITRQASGATAYVVNKQNVVEERAVTLGAETSSRVEVLSGLAENDLLMVGSRAQVRPGQRVEVKLLPLTAAAH